jgi:hypothetical protein
VPIEDVALVNQAGETGGKEYLLDQLFEIEREISANEAAQKKQ